MTDAINWHPLGTLGPWGLGDSDIPVSGMSVHGSGDGHSTVARLVCGKQWDKSFKEAYANARAIAEVPAMVMALRAIAYLEPRTHVQEHWFSEARAILSRIDGGAA